MQQIKDMSSDDRNYLMRCLADALKSALRPLGGNFVLLVLHDEPADGQSTQYISDCDPVTIPEALREAASRIERREQHKRN